MSLQKEKKINKILTAAQLEIGELINNETTDLF